MKYISRWSETGGARLRRHDVGTLARHVTAQVSSVLTHGILS
jgi:hypothetical protein